MGWNYSCRHTATSWTTWRIINIKCTNMCHRITKGRTGP
uniref:Uncharacterized protein n=1 Tax=Rhizophora mucronata TaxID=61149 RepID=A0A2P2QZ13_RHIMU